MTLQQAFRRARILDAQNVFPRVHLVLDNGTPVDVVALPTPDDDGISLTVRSPAWRNAPQELVESWAAEALTKINLKTNWAVE